MPVIYDRYYKFEANSTECKLYKDKVINVHITTNNLDNFIWASVLTTTINASKSKGHKVIYGSSGANSKLYYYGGLENDLVFLAGGTNTIEDWSGDNEIVSHGGKNDVTLGKGDDIVTDFGSKDSIYKLGDGANSFSMRGGINTKIFGGDDTDFFSFHSGKNVTYHAGYGHDTVYIHENQNSPSDITIYSKDHINLVLWTSSTISYKFSGGKLFFYNGQTTVTLNHLDLDTFSIRKFIDGKFVTFKYERKGNRLVYHGNSENSSEYKNPLSQKQQIIKQTTAHLC